MAEEKEKKQKKKIPDYARRDIVGVYYSQMRLWQGAFFLSVIVAGLLAYALVFKTKHHYFFTDGYQIIRLKETTPRIDLFLQRSIKDMLTISYTNFDEKMEEIKDYLTAKTYDKFKQGAEVLKERFKQNKLVWTPSTPEVYTMQKNDRVIFSARVKIVEVSAKTGKKGERIATVEGEVVPAQPEGNNLFPYRIRNLKIKFGGG